jgi:hypothetical protein
MTIVAAAGRRIDAPDASPPRFPLANRDAIRERVRAALIEHEATGIVASGACGADLLVQEVARELDLPCRRMILPFAAETFRHSSVADRPGDWGPLFDALLAELAGRGDVVTLAEDPSGDAAYAAVNKVILAEAGRMPASLRRSSCSSGTALAVAKGTLPPAWAFWPASGAGRSQRY